MSAFCLKEGRIRQANKEDVIGRSFTAVYHLAANGTITKINDFPELSNGEGVLAYFGELCIEPLEIQIEFIKTTNAEKWLNALIVRHLDRLRFNSDNLFVIAEMKEVNV